MAPVRGARFDGDAFRERLGAVAARSETVLPVMILGLSIFLIIDTDAFLTGGNFKNLARQGAVLAVLAFGQTVVVLARQLDLSVSATMSLVSVVTARVAVDSDSSWALALAIPIGLAAGTLNGVLIGYFPHVGHRRDARYARLRARHRQCRLEGAAHLRPTG